MTRMDQTNSSPANGASHVRAGPARSGVRRIAAGVLVGSATAMGMVLVFLILSRGSSAVPEISRADLQAAEEKWDRQGPKSYDMDLEIGGRQPGPVHIEVRQGRVTRMTCNG